MFLLLTLNIFHTFSAVSIVDFEQVNVNWDCSFFALDYTAESFTLAEQSHFEGFTMLLLLGWF